MSKKKNNNRLSKMRTMGMTMFVDVDVVAITKVIIPNIATCVSFILQRREKT